MASQPDLTNIAISSGYATLIHTEESGGVSGTFTNLYDGDGTLTVSYTHLRAHET